MGSDVEIVRALPEEAWRRFVDDHPGGNVFHTPEMFRVFSHAAGHRPMLWAAVRDGRPVALLPVVQVTVFGSLLRRLTTRAVAYGGAIHAPGLEGTRGLRRLLDAYTRTVQPVPLFTELRHMTDVTGLDGLLHEAGFRHSPHLNYLITLSREPQDVLQAIGRRTRKHIRRGLRNHRVTVREVENREDVRRVYELLATTYTAARIPLAHPSLFEAAFDVLRPRRMVKFLLATVDEEPAACSVELIHKNRIYGWYSGTRRRYRGLTPNELLMWHILRWGSVNGYGVYDFGGAGRPDEKYGVRAFKGKFGGTLVCFGRHRYVHLPGLLRVSQAGYRIARICGSMRPP